MGSGEFQSTTHSFNKSLKVKVPQSSQKNGTAPVWEHVPWSPVRSAKKMIDIESIFPK